MLICSLTRDLLLLVTCMCNFLKEILEIQSVFKNNLAIAINYKFINAKFWFSPLSTWIQLSDHSFSANRADRFLLFT